MARSRIAISAIGAMSFLAACTDGGTTSSPPTSAAPNAEAPSALQFSAPSVGGGTIDFTQFAGRTVVLWFWAPT